MNWRRAVYAASAGLVTAFIIIGTFIAGLFFFGVDLVGGSGPPSVIEQLWWYIAIPTIASLSAVLPLRILGVRWWRCLIITLAAHISALIIIKIVQVISHAFDLIAFDFWVILSAAIAIILAIIEIKAVKTTRVIIILVITIILALLPTTIDFLFISPIFAWLIFPDVTVLFYHQDSKNSADIRLI
jgi:hypothetical protein